MTADEIIAYLDLSPLPIEGGFFRVSYLSDECIPASALPRRYQGDRRAGNAIFFLETAEQFSAMHTLATDENYYFHYGDAIEMLLLHPDGRGELKYLGCDFAQGEMPQICVPYGVCHGSRPRAGGAFGFSLVGTSMAPGYAENDVMFPERKALHSAYPEWGRYIDALTRSHAVNTA